MINKTSLLIAAIAAGVTLAASAEARGFGPQGGDRPAFEELDLNGDGGLTLQELQEAMQARGAARFAEADTNGDGALSAEEMIAAASERHAETIAERVEKRIDALDTNDDGLIQQGELQAAAEDRPRGGGERMFQRADADEDGVISAEEYAAMAERGGHRRGN